MNRAHEWLLPEQATAPHPMAKRRSHTISSPGPARVLGICLTLFAVVTCVFLPSLWNGFLGYDDTLFVTDNPQVSKGLTWQSIDWAFRTPVVGLWHPLTMISHMLDCQFYGLDPLGHHLTNVLIHAVSTVLLFLLFRQMTGALWRSALLAALFGLHPLRVESVAWVAERKDVLSALFWMLCLGSWLRYAKPMQAEQTHAVVAESIASRSWISRRISLFPWGWYLISFILFIMGLMSKPMLITLPFVLLLLDFWPLRRASVASFSTQTGLRLIIEKVPFFALSALFAAITVRTQAQASALSSGLSVTERLANASVSTVRYVGKMFWPTDLSVFYPHPHHWPAWQVVVSVALLVFAFAAVLLAARKRPYLAFGWLWFCGTLVPVIGLVQAGEQSMADRYTYIPSIGLMFLTIWFLGDIASARRWRVRPMTAGVIALLIVLSATTVRQIRFWKDNETLFSHAIAVTSNNDLAHYNLGSAFLLKEDFEKAIPHFEEAVRVNPGKADARKGLGYADLRLHRFSEAVEQFEAVLRLAPDDADAHRFLAGLFAAMGQMDKAIEHYEETARLLPADAQVRYDLGATLASRGDAAHAAQQFELSLKARPGSAEAHYALGIAYRSLRRMPDALREWRSASRLAPQWAEPLNNLAWVLSTDPDASLRNSAEAVSLAAKAQKLDGSNSPGILDTLAAAYAEGGRFDEAISAAEAARKGALASGRREQARQIEARLALYRSHQPYRETELPK